MTSPHSRRLLLLAIAYLAFISLGLPDPLIGVAWPWVRRDFGLPLDAVALIFFGFGLSYFLSSFFTGRLLKICGIGVLLAVSSGLVALGGFGFALAPVWFLFAACALLHGLGSGAIDSGLNHYVAHHFSARHMNWLHA
ncbi:MAG TPA: MFS transporter, partial [Prosthecobacter sp.]|nr:MFS transporter [Prosthecobacter sp.]